MGTALTFRLTERHYPRQWGGEGFDACDDGRVVGYIYRVNDANALRIGERRPETWAWGIDFSLTHYACNGTVASLEEAEATFLYQYERWLKYQTHKSIIEKDPLNLDEVANATLRFVGAQVGCDGKSHDLFRLDLQDQTNRIGDFYGIYQKLYMPGGNHFNVEFGRFGFLDNYNFGNPDPSGGRRRFSADEAQAIEQRIRRFVSDPATFTKTGGVFLGGATFLADWILLQEATNA
jgi:hypothetical protein